jgi:hypothetical protein
MGSLTNGDGRRAVNDEFEFLAASPEVIGHKAKEVQPCYAAL